MNAISQISSEMSAALALDLAANLWPEATVFQNHGLDPVYGAALLQQDWFRKMVDESRREWGSISNAKQRIKLKSQIAVEMSIDELYLVVTDSTNPAAARVAAFKELKDVAGVATQEQSGPASNAPMVNIYLGGEDGPSFSVTGRTPRREADDDIIDVTPSNRDDFLGIAPL